MAKWTGSGTSTYQAKVKKKCNSFKREWLSEYVQTEEQEEQAVTQKETMLSVTSDTALVMPGKHKLQLY